MPLLCLLACAPTRYVRPLAEGELAVGADLGGPLISFSDVVIPLPLTNVNVGYGLTGNTTVFGGLHTTALAFKLLQLDAGAVHAFRQPAGFVPGFSASGTLNLMTGLSDWQTRLFPQADLNAFWEHGARRNVIYFGMSNWFETKSTRAHGEEQPAHWLPSLQLGYTFVRSKWDYTVELKQVAFNQDESKIVVDYYGPGDKGASGVYFGLRRRF